LDVDRKIDEANTTDCRPRPKFAPEPVLRFLLPLVDSGAPSSSSLLMQPGRPARFPAWLPWLRKVCRSGTAFLDLFRQLDAADVALH